MSSRSGTKALAAAIVLGTALAGCSEIYYDRRETVSPGAGDAIASNKVTHTIDPWPRASANDRIAFNGQRMQAAQDRYNRGQVITPVLPTQPSRDYQAAQQQAAGQQSATSQSTSAAPAAPVRGP
ncbi:MAG: hypothetical protein IT536_20330 [Hyphomicrobiales bacterium]|nr:hypothetical protein [Hyphomicrobiales bacterium]